MLTLPKERIRCCAVAKLKRPTRCDRDLNIEVCLVPSQTWQLVPITKHDNLTEMHLGLEAIYLLHGERFIQIMAHEFVGC
jgi:hypothetical protein